MAETRSSRQEIMATNELVHARHDLNGVYYRANLVTSRYFWDTRQRVQTHV
jgi:hypothetical protein